METVKINKYWSGCTKKIPAGTQAEAGAKKKYRQIVNGGRGDVK